AEAFARSTKGAVGLTAATEVSYSFVNDTYLWGMFDEMWPNFMPAYGTAKPVRIMPAFGNAAGKYFLKQSSWPYNTDNKEVTYYLFHHLGDAFQTVYSEVPQNLTVSHNPVIISGQTTFAVTANVNSLIALTKAGEILSTATGTGAPVNMTIPVLVPGDIVTVTVTNQNYYRYSQQLQVVPSEGAYVVQNGYTLNDSTGNVNGLADYGETVKLSLNVKNVGNQPASNVSVFVSTADSFAVVLDSSEVYGTITAGAALLKTNAFTVKLNNNIPNLHVIPLLVRATDGVNNWTSNISITAHAPVLTYTGYSIIDSLGNNNGRVDPGETFKIKVDLKNTGTAKAVNVQGSLSTISPYVTITGSSATYGDLDTNAVISRYFTATASSTAPSGQMCQFVLSFTGNLGINAAGTFNTFIGKIPSIIIDLDGNHNSASAIKSTFDSLQIPVQVVTEFPSDLSLYSSVFVCLGIYSSNHALSSGEGTALANYLTQGGMLYMEGGDTWYYDAKTAVHPMFKITGTTDGASDLGTINGQTNSFTSGMSFVYSGDNSYIDHITPTSGSTAYYIFQNASPAYGCGVAYSAGSYNTVGTSFEFGGIPAASGIRTQYLNKILTLFNVAVTPVELTSLAANTTENNNVKISWETATEVNNSGFEIERSSDNKTFVKIAFVKGNGTTTEKHQYSYTDNAVMNSSKFYYRLKQMDLDGTTAYSKVVEVNYSNCPKQFSLSQNYPNPFNPSTTIQFSVPTECVVMLKVYDVLGKEVTTLVNDKMKPGYYKYQWNASGYASGIYFYKITAGSFNAVKKLMLIK
ncbi:MAG: T9SS type A sorting domain-containing protein, partial [Bacteroidota bacterium]|nr:T9SS type A sorting domain-containing protein [Bacteroidota bacterium]